MNINDIVTLKVDLPENNLLKGMNGVIVCIFNEINLVYEVEFCTEKGETIATLALKSHQIVLCVPSRRPIEF